MKKTINWFLLGTAALLLWTRHEHQETRRRVMELERVTKGFDGVMDRAEATLGRIEAQLKKPVRVEWVTNGTLVTTVTNKADWRK